MAIKWGSKVTRSTGAWQQLGIEATLSGSTITVRYYGNSNGVNGTWTLTRTGSISGGVSVTWNNGGGQTLLRTDTMAASPGNTYTFGASLPTWWGGPAVTVSGVTVGSAATPPSPPTAATATYVNDHRIDVSWTRPSNADTPATLWERVRITRTDSKSNYTVFATVATLAGNATGWTDFSVQPNERYRYIVAPGNAGGEATLGITPTHVSTSPAAPTQVGAMKSLAGDIVVWWDGSAPIAQAFEVQDDPDEGGSPATVGTPAASPFTHVSPSGGYTHRYRVRAVVDGVRYSQWSPWSNTVALEQPPAQPTNLSPNGTYADSSSPLVLTWQHNPVDTTPQTAYEVDHKLFSAGSWTTVSGTTAQQHTLTGYAAGQNVQWRVRTKGAHADWSEYSALAAFTLAAAPTATLNAPGSTVVSSSVLVEWAYYQPVPFPQAGYEVELYRGATLVARSAGSTATLSWQTPNVLADGETYTVRVRVMSSVGLWSAWDEQTFTVDYDEPAPSLVDAQWQDGYGNVLIAFAAVSEEDVPETVTHRVERSTDGGNTWVLVADDLPTDGTIVDWQSPSAGAFHYRVKAISALPSMAETIVEVTVPDTPINCVVWISGGPGFALAYPIRHNPELTYEGGRDRTLHDFDGRTYPVEHSSTSVPRVLSVSGSIMPDSYTPSTGGAVSTREGLEDLFDMPGPHLYRDPTGRVMYGTVSALRWTRSPGGLGQVAFTITRSAPPTDAQASSMTGWFAPRIAQVAPGLYAFINADAEAAAPGVFEEVV